jgi:hypothetical protein
MAVTLFWSEMVVDIVVEPLDALGGNAGCP